MLYIGVKFLPKFLLWGIVWVNFSERTCCFLPCKSMLKFWYVIWAWGHKEFWNIIRQCFVLMRNSDFWESNKGLDRHISDKMMRTKWKLDLSKTTSWIFIVFELMQVFCTFQGSITWSISLSVFCHHCWWSSRENCPYWCIAGLAEKGTECKVKICRWPL